MVCHFNKLIKNQEAGSYREPVFESVGRRFESCRARQIYQRFRVQPLSLFLFGGTICTRTVQGIGLTGYKINAEYVDDYLLGLIPY